MEVEFGGKTRVTIRTQKLQCRRFEFIFKHALISVLVIDFAYYVRYNSLIIILITFGGCAVICASNTREILEHVHKKNATCKMPSKHFRRIRIWTVSPSRIDVGVFLFPRTVRLVSSHGAHMGYQDILLASVPSLLFGSSVFFTPISFIDAACRFQY